MSTKALEHRAEAAVAARHVAKGLTARERREVRMGGKTITVAKLFEKLLEREAIIIAVPEGKRPRQVQCLDCKTLVDVCKTGPLPKRCQVCAFRAHKGPLIVDRPETVACASCGGSVPVHPTHGSIPRECKRCRRRRGSADQRAKDPDKSRKAAQEYQARKRADPVEAERKREQNRAYMATEKGKVAARARNARYRARKRAKPLAAAAPIDPVTADSGPVPAE